ncbi:hypothetical protein ACP275_06G155600 [Erythranthe tilingii]
MHRIFTLPPLLSNIIKNQREMSAIAEESLVHLSSIEDSVSLLDAELASADFEDVEEDQDTDLKREPAPISECKDHVLFGRLCLECHMLINDDGAAVRYIHKNLPLASNEMDRLRDENSKELLRDRKLSLVLDLDHTLLNSTDLSDITSEETYLNCERDVLPEYLKSSLFRVDTMKMLTKLRPYVNTFLKEASKLYELHIYTMGDRSYALEMAKLLDPENIYFNSRIISRDDSTRMLEKGLDVVLGKENAIVILDDKESVWRKKDKDNVIVIERYDFFASSCNQFGHDHKSHSQLKSDESESEGALATSLKILQQIHTLFFDLGHKDSLEDRDLRKVLKSVRKEVIKGCKVVFSDEISSYSLQFRKMAEELGAELCDETEACVTHVVSIDLRDDKSIWAMKEKKFLVTPNWIRVSYHMCRKQPEENFPVRPPTKNFLVLNKEASFMNRLHQLM